MNIAALRIYFQEQTGAKQSLGTIDCVKFVTNAVYIGWGRDYRDILQYSSRREAVDRLRELGGLKGACFHALGAMDFITDLHPGDIIWYDEPPTLGLLMPNYVAVRQGQVINRYAIEECMMGWRT